jgi:nicotinamide riboside transporter PnuC
VSWAITILALTARYTAAKMNRITWVLSAVNQLLYIVLVLKEKNPNFYGLLPLSVVNFCFCFYGYREWTKKMEAYARIETTRDD